MNVVAYGHCKSVKFTVSAGDTPAQVGRSDTRDVRCTTLWTDAAPESTAMTRTSNIGSKSGDDTSRWPRTVPLEMVKAVSRGRLRLVVG